MKAFRISGRFRMGRRWQAFSKELAASDEAAAREKLLSVLGSQHGVPRKYVAIAQAAEVLVPIGANSFLVAQSKDVDKAFVSIGSDLLAYDDMDRQVERLDARIKSITEAANAIGQRLGDLQRRAEAHGAAVQDLYDRLQGPGAPGERS